MIDEIKQININMQMKMLLLCWVLPILGMTQQLVKTEDYHISLDLTGRVLVVIKKSDPPYSLTTSKHLIEQVREGNGFTQYHLSNGQSLLIEDTLFFYCYLWESYNPNSTSIKCDTVYIPKDNGDTDTE